MIHYNFTSKSQKVVIEIKDSFDPEVDNFAGLYLMGQKIPENVFIDENLLLWNAIVDGNHRPMLIDLEKASYDILDPLDHTILDVKGSQVVLAQDNPLNSQALKVATLNVQEKKLENLIDLCPSLDNELDQDVIAEKLIHDPKDGSGLKFSSIYIGPKEGKAPLIVWPHGGPHSIIPWAFSNDLYYFVQQGKKTSKKKKSK